MERKICNKIEECRIFINTLSTKVNDHDKTVSWFKHFCDLLSKVLVSTTCFVKESKEICDRNVSKALLLYLTQLITLLSVLIKIFVRENDVDETINEARYCISKQLILCLDSISGVIRGEKVDDNGSGSFLKWMDYSLNALALIDVEDKRTVMENYDDAHKHVEEVLCHAMSIAQVAFTDDCKIIKGSSQAVLDSLQSLFLELDKKIPHTAMCNLSIDSCYDKLCALERKVNTGVLKLSLRVFSEYIKPLNALHDYTFAVGNEHIEAKFDNLIADFDLHVDRIMQIGLFAIASSSNAACAIKMKSCLASLEALEGELVPSFNAVIINRSSHNTNFALLLKAHWIQQAECLKHLIYAIIDPFAFCQVTYEELRRHIDGISEIMIQNDGFDKELLDPIFSETKILMEVITTSFEDTQLINIDEVKKHCKDIKLVLHEIKCAANKLLTENRPNKYNSLRVLKRCKILQSSMKKLLYNLAEDLNELEIDSNKENDVNEINGKAVESKIQEDNHSLNHIMTRGKDILKDRSVLYKTPVKNVTNRSITSKIIPKINDKALPLSKLVHLRNLQFSYSRIRNETPIDLQITDILDDLENLSASFSMF